MARKTMHYTDKTEDYVALMVERNAPRGLQMLLKHGFMSAPSELTLAEIFQHWQHHPRRGVRLDSWLL